jgi:hypothetical protein
MTAPLTRAQPIPTYAIIPTYNQPEMLDALTRQLCAPHDLAEIIILDNHPPHPDTPTPADHALQWRHHPDTPGTGAPPPIDTGRPPWRTPITIYTTPRLTINTMWNLGAQIAQRDAARTGHLHWNLLILNDDLVIPPTFTDALTRVLRLGDPAHPRNDNFFIRLPGPVRLTYPDYDDHCSTSPELTRDWPATTGWRHEPALRPEAILTYRPTHGTYRHGGMSGWAYATTGETWPGIDPNLNWWAGDDDLAANIQVAGGSQLRVGIPTWHAGSATATQHPDRIGDPRADLEHFTHKWLHRHKELGWI